jgi:hypothetical protein
LVQISAMTPIGEDVPATDGEHTVKREAKSNRKVRWFTVIKGRIFICFDRLQT